MNLSRNLLLLLLLIALICTKNSYADTEVAISVPRCFDVITNDHANAPTICGELLDDSNIQVSANDKSRIFIGLASIRLTQGNFEKADNLLREAIQGNDYLLGDNLHRYNWLRLRGAYFFSQDRFKESLPYFEDAQALANRIQSEFNVAKSANDVATNLMEMGRFREALNGYKTSLDIFTVLEDYYQMAFSLAGIGIAHKDLAEYEIAQTFFERGLEAIHQHLKKNPEDDYGIYEKAKIQFELALILIIKTELESAESYLIKAEETFSKMKKMGDLVKTEVAKSQISLSRQEKDHALKLAISARAMEQEHGFHLSLEVYEQLVKTFSAQQIFERAVENAKAGLALAEQQKSLSSELFFLKWLGEHFAENRQADVSLAYFERYLSKYENYIDYKYSPAVADLRAVIQVKQQQQDITLLEKDKQLAKIELQQKSLIIISLSALAVGFVMLSLYLKRQNARQRIALNREITMHRDELLRLTQQDVDEGTDENISDEELDEIKPVEDASYVEEAFRTQLVELMILACEYWEHSTGKNQLELAEKSNIWAIIVDDGRLRTRTMDKYLSLPKMPKKPRWRQVVRTCRFVLVECELSTKQRDKLNTCLENTLTLQRKTALLNAQL